jgi:hypothetical protein
MGERMSEEVFDAWLTRHALNNGVRKARVKLCSAAADMVEVVGSRYAEYYHGEGRDWHRTESSAIARAEKMRAAKILSSRKQIAKLEKLTFSASDRA